MPACSRCHGVTSTDDEYFKFALCARADTYDHPDARNAWAGVMRAIRMPEKRRMRRALFSSMVEVDLSTPSGVYVGKAGAFVVQPARLCSVANRIVQGLYWHHVRAPLPASYRAHSIWFHGSNRQTPEALTVLVEQLKAILWVPGRRVGADTFAYAYAFDPTDPHTSLWLMSFYGSFVFHGSTGPRGPGARA